MAPEVDDTGTIADTSRDRCSVKVKIDGKEETLSFSKKCLYAYGFQCEGDMTNILDPGTEVNLCYRLSQSRNNPTILIVWIGDKPDQDTLSSELLEAVYGQEGLVDQALDDTNYLISGNDMLSTVIVSKDVVYRDGCPSSTALSVGDRIIFDAAPSESALPSGAKYQATCAWTGSKPRLVDRFGLSAKESIKSEKVKLLETNVIDGTVFVIANDVVAFVKAEVENVAVKVILFRSSFSDKRGRIQEIVQVGEKIRMRLRFKVIFRGKRQWFAAKAWKDGETIPADDRVKVDGKLAELESLATNVQSSVKSSSANVCRRSPSPAAIANPATLSNQTVSGAGHPSTYGNRNVPSGYPAVAPGYPASWLSYSNSRMYPVGANVFPMLYPNNTPGFPIGMVGLPVRYGYPAYVAANPTAFVGFPSSAVGRPFVQARQPGNPSNARNLPAAESAPSMVRKPAIPVIDPKTGFPVATVQTGQPVYPPNARNLPAAESAPSMAHKPTIPVIDPVTGFPVVTLATPDSRFTATSEILYSDPPLTGIISSKRAKETISQTIISYGNILIEVKRDLIFIDRRQCTEEQFQTLIASGKTVVHFEATLTWSAPKNPKKSPSHLATCVWLGEKPTMLDVVSYMYPPDTSVLGRKDTVFYGRVKKMCLPDIALLQIREINQLKTTVCVHVSAFRSKLTLKPERLSEEASIAHFIRINHWLSFRIVSVAACPIVLTAVDVKLLGATKGMKKMRALDDAERHEQKNGGIQNRTGTEVPVSHVKSGTTGNGDSSSDSENETSLDAIPSATGSNAEHGPQTSMVHKPAMPVIDPVTGFPVVTLATPDSRFTATSEILYNDPPLTGIISEKRRKNTSSTAIISYGNILINAKRTLIYIDKRQCTSKQFRTLIASGKIVVHFEATVNVCAPKDPKKSPFYLATCVWLGEKPTMLDLMSDMCQPDLSVLGRKETVFFGRVKKLCLPDIALLQVIEWKTTVCVHVSAFTRKLQPNSECLSEDASIAHFIRRNHWLSFRIVSDAACPIVLTAIDVKLLGFKKEMEKVRALYYAERHEQRKGGSQNRTGTEVPVSHVKSGTTSNGYSSSDSENETPRDSIPSAGSNAGHGLSLGTAANTEIESKPKNFSCSKNVPNTGTELDADVGHKKSGHSYQAAVFMAHSKPSEMRTRILNCSGILHIEREDGLTIYKVEPDSGLSCNLLCTPKILEHCRRFNSVFAEHDGLKVQFNAECNYVGNKVDFCINRISWGTRISGVHMLYTDLAREEDPKFEHNVPLRAVVSSITQHDAAVAVFDGTPIIIPFEALHLSEECSNRCDFSSVDQFLRIGDEVILTDIDTRIYFPGLSSAKLLYYVAGSCWRAVKIGPSEWNEIKIPEVQEDPSWLDRWLCGEFSRRECVVKKGDSYFVDFVSSKIPNLKLSLDVFERSKFFDSGEPKDIDSASDLENREVKFHVAHGRDLQNSDNIPREFFVKYAWIGDDPDCLNVLKDELEVPDGLVVDSCDYVAVIEDFVLPTHMICKIGVVPVVVPFPQVAHDVSEGDFLAETSTRCKSQVVVKVRETFYKGLTFLESEFARKKETLFDDSGVLIACKGDVVVPPCPEGVIRCRASKTNVRFHLCSVLPERESSLNRNERFELFKHLKSTIQAGTKVCFSAAKYKEKTDYYAYQVWLN